MIYKFSQNFDLPLEFLQGLAIYLWLPSLHLGCLLMIAGSTIDVWNRFVDGGRFGHVLMPQVDVLGLLQFRWSSSCQGFIRCKVSADVADVDRVVSACKRQFFGFCFFESPLLIIYVDAGFLT